MGTSLRERGSAVVRVPGCVLVGVPIRALLPACVPRHRLILDDRLRIAVQGKSVTAKTRRGKSCVGLLDVVKGFSVKSSETGGRR